MASFTIEYMKYCPEWLQVDEENVSPFVKESSIE